MMKASNLIKIYEEQLKNMNELLTAATTKQKSVIQNNRISLEQSTKEEETILSRINRKEIERIDYLQKLFANNNSGKNLDEDYLSNMYLEELRQMMEEKEFLELSDLRDSIKKIIAQVMGVNQQNKFLIEQANSIVRSTLAIVLKSQKKPLVDRRV